MTIASTGDYIYPTQYDKHMFVHTSVYRLVVLNPGYGTSKWWIRAVRSALVTFTGQLWWILQVYHWPGVILYHLGFYATAMGAPCF